MCHVHVHVHVHVLCAMSMSMYYVLCAMYYVLCAMYYVLCTMCYVLCTQCQHVSTMPEHSIAARTSSRHTYPPHTVRGYRRDMRIAALVHDFGELTARPVLDPYLDP